uniref:Uncharacterized protein n=1 Tax=Myotis myotis TaxID=51298 RepID=A0A7J7V3J0_MYOMY|nr:hypothetical protein mMyoMyo1_008438 [Myotis myotis]
MNLINLKKNFPWMYFSSSRLKCRQVSRNVDSPHSPRTCMSNHSEGPALHSSFVCCCQLSVSLTEKAVSERAFGGIRSMRLLDFLGQGDAVQISGTMVAVCHHPTAPPLEGPRIFPCPQLGRDPVGPAGNWEFSLALP